MEFNSVSQKIAWLLCRDNLKIGEFKKNHFTGRKKIKAR
jgi:hypothetical protein